MRYEIDSKRQAMTATGLVNKVMVWEEVNGRRKPSETNQERHEDTGMPLWGVEVMYRADGFQQKHVTATVKVGALEQPEPDEFSAITFKGLAVEARTNKSGGMTEYWSAEEVDHFKRAKASATAPKPASANGEAA